MAKTAAGEVAALRQRYIDDLWLVAGDIRLIDLLGTASVQATLCAAFDGPPMSAVLERQARNYASEDYDGLSGSFARAFREADRERRPVRRTSGKPVNGQLPESTRQAVEWLLKNKDAVRLNRFVAEHSLSDAQVIVAYIKRRQS